MPSSLVIPEAISELRSLVREANTQASFAAVILLALYLGPSVELEVSDALVTHLIDDVQRLFFPVDTLYEGEYISIG